ncbi:MAG TPA: RNA methyltransferase, partial [Planctomycetaceae bacterium]|nr:RNA methyltransferase [Planctomycetaceae bacterium]
MAERTRRGKRKRALLGSHQRCWLWGRHLVTETLRAGRWPVLELRLSERLPADELYQARTLATGRGLSVLLEPHDNLTRLARSPEHQGYLARMPPFPYDDLETLLARRPATPLYLMLDRVQDPYNFGAILRAADGLGADAVFVDVSGQSDVTSLTARASAGAINHVPLAQAADLPALVERLRGAGHLAAAASHTADADVFDYDFRGPTLVIVGNEGAGIRPEILSRCDRRVRIPQFGRVSSLNAAVATGILLYEVRRQRGNEISASGRPALECGDLSPLSLNGDSA